MNNRLSRVALTACSAALALGSMSAVAGKASDEPIVIKEAPLHERLADARPNDIKMPEVMTKAPVDPDFKKLDVNNDSRVSLKEAIKDRNLAMQFDAIDVNHDGMISADEYAGYKASLAARGTDAVTPVTN